MANRWTPTWGLDELEIAKRDVSQGMSVRKASARYSIPRTTLRDHVQGRVRSSSGKAPRPLSKGRPTLLGETYEQQLKEYALNMSKIYYGITRNDLRRLAFEVAELTKTKHPFDRSAKMAGLKWTRLFLARHPDMTLRTPEPTSIARLAGFRKSEVQLFFDNLEGLMKKHAYPPNRVFNMDETAVSTVMDPPRVVSPKGARRVGVVTSAERGQNSTAVICCNAAGIFLPPQFIFARKRHNLRLEKGAPPGSVFTVSDNGWATKDTFVKWLEHFVEQTGASQDKPQLLVMDNHSSHVSLAAIETAIKNGIDILTLPPHTSHRLQPLDVTVFEPIKTRYRNEMARWMRQNPQRVTTYDVCELFGAAYLTNASPDKAVSGFRVCGIVPVNRDIFTEDDYEAAEHVLADRLQAKDNQVASTAAENRVADDFALTGPSGTAAAAGPSGAAAGAGPSGAVAAAGPSGAAAAAGPSGAAAGAGPSGAAAGAGPSGAAAGAGPSGAAAGAGPSGAMAAAGPSGAGIPERESGIADLLILPRPSPKATTRMRKAQRSQVLTSSPSKRKLQDNELQRAAKKATKVDKTVKETTRKPVGKAAKKITPKPVGKVAKKMSPKPVGTAAKKTTPKPSMNSVTDICMYCSETVVEQGELWLQCKECDLWCHEACSGGLSSGGNAYVCDYCA